jgi:hypothetical protein
VPFGDVTFALSSAGDRSDRCSSSPAPSYSRPRELIGEFGIEPCFTPSFGETLREQKDVGWTAAGNRSDRVHQALIFDPHHLAHRLEQTIALERLVARHRGAGASDRHAAPDRGGGVRHGPHDCCAFRQISREARKRAPCGDR